MARGAVLYDWVCLSRVEPIRRSDGAVSAGGDYAAFERIMIEARERVELPLLAWCLMSNHWHFVVRPTTDTQVTEFFRWLATRTRCAGGCTRAWDGGIFTRGGLSVFRCRGRAFSASVRVCAAECVVCRGGAAGRGVALGEFVGGARRSGGVAGVGVALAGEPAGDWLEHVNAPLTAKECHAAAVERGSRAAVWRCGLDRRDGGGVVAGAYVAERRAAAEGRGRGWGRKLAASPFSWSGVPADRTSVCSKSGRTGLGDQTAGWLFLRSVTVACPGGWIGGV